MTEVEKVYRAHFNDVYRYILKLSGDEDTAEEITSETFFKAMRSLGGFRGDCDIRVWLCQIAKNCYYTSVKKSGKTELVDDAALWELPSGESAVEEQCVRREEAARIRVALGNLPGPYREVFTWRVLAELSFKQIGQLFGKSENWACVTYHRAKAMLKSRLEDKDCEE